MTQADEAEIAETVSGLELATAGIVAILEGHGKMLARLLEAAEETPAEESGLAQLLKALIDRLDRQQQTLNRIEQGIGTFNNALAKTGQP